MPALNLTFTDDEMEALRAAASARRVSLKAFAHDAVLASSSEHSLRVGDAARRVAERSAELNKRLA
ncbi:antitoxin Phd [Nocardia veterana]|uniref:Antitoxin Phd n=1 Tax=Nocardia veterana TaxID=132249 RepID=A0A7X6M441_9NOCA|nr:antitoxin Phd [Nocardia veterana]NKY89846.1 antitoxin Phd [Nocardia veterana]